MRVQIACLVLGDPAVRMNKRSVALYQPDSKLPHVPDLAAHDAYFYRRHSLLPCFRRATWPVDSQEWGPE